MTQLKSLAHPSWPYTGTPWEWRGFGKLVGEILEADKQPPEAAFKDGQAMLDWLNETIYQKQNFGPELK